MFPFFIHYLKVNQNVFYKVKDDIYVRPMKRVKTTVRVIASQLTPDEISGSEYAGLDVMVATGRATTFLYDLEKHGRFKDAYIAYEEDGDLHMRWGKLPNQSSVNDFKGVTHFHFITCHSNKIDVPEVHELYEIDLTTVDVYQMNEDGTLTQLTDANCEINTLDCPFAINSYVLNKMQSFKNLVVRR